MEPITFEWFDELYSENPELWAAVTVALGICSKAGLPIGKDRSGTLDLDDNEILAVYVMDCKQVGLTHHDVSTYCHEARRRFRFFPSSSEFSTTLAKVKAEQRPTGFSDPAYMVDMSEQHPSLRVGSRALMERKGIECYGTEREAQEAIPALLATRNANLPAKVN